MSKTKHIIIGEVSADLYDDIMKGARKTLILQYRNMMKGQIPDKFTDESLPDDKVIGEMMMDMILKAYEDHRAREAASAAGKMSRQETRKQLGLKP